MRLNVNDLSQKIEKKQIFKNVTFTLESGEILAVVGRNGSGKTTLMQTMVSILSPLDGSVDVDGSNVEIQPEVLQNIIYIPDKFDYFRNTSLKNVLKYYNIVYDDFSEEKFRSFISELDLLISDKKSMSTLSKGELSLVAISLALSTDCKFILLDEPFDGIDVINTGKLKKLIIIAKEENRGVFISSHRLEVLEKIVDKSLFLEIGKGVKLFEESNNRNFYKYQLVVREELSKKLENHKDICVIQKIGRIYTVLVNGVKKDFEDLFDFEEVVQYDELIVLMEDIFKWESVKKEVR